MAKQYKNRMGQQHTAKLTEWLLLNKARLVQEETSWAALSRLATEELQLSSSVEGEVINVPETALKALCETLGIQIRLTKRSENSGIARRHSLLQKRVDYLEDCLIHVCSQFRELEKQLSFMDDRAKSFNGRFLAELLRKQLKHGIETDDD